MARRSNFELSFPADTREMRRRRQTGGLRAQVLAIIIKL